LSPISWFSYSITKAGNTEVENEDAVFPEAGVGQNGHGELATFIVADGATQTSFSGLWAKCLINSCSQTNLSEFNFYRAVSKAQAEWQNSLHGIELPWHAQQKFQQGAFSALAWLEIHYFPLHPAYAFSWRALAVGDCCLFIARNKEIYLSLPLQDQSEFLNTPVLIPSISEKMESIKGKVQTARGSLVMGDQLILASDAISAWIMRRSQADRLEFLNMVKSIKSARNDSGFSNWINILRKKSELKNDDTSLILIELGQGGV
jgi:hypothetical protein